MARPKYLTVREFARDLGVQVKIFNAERYHRGIKATPDSKAAQCHLERERLDPELVARALMRREKSVTLTNDGIEFLGVKYFHHAFIGHVGETVEIGWLEQHPEYIEVFDPNHATGEATWMCRARPASEATKGMAGRVYAARRHAMEFLSTVQAVARAMEAQEQAEARARQAPLDPELEDAPARRSRRRRSDTQVRQTNDERLAQLVREGVLKDAAA